MPLTCLKVTLKREDIKLLHECISKIVEGNMLLEKEGQELFYGYLGPLPPLEECYTLFAEDSYYKFFCTHAVFGYYLFFDNNEPEKPIGFIEIGLYSSGVPGVVNKSKHF